MISRLKGTLLKKDFSAVEVETPGGVVYEVEVPLTVLQRLPPEGTPVELRTFQVNRQDFMALFGFLEPSERNLFRRLLGAAGVGPSLALAMLSTFSAPRLAQALAEKDLAALTQVSGIGKKKAERIVLELADKVKDLALVPEGPGAGSSGSREAVSALIALGYSFSEADAAVRQVLEQDEDLTIEALIRKALAGK
ncbi:MAG: Holliday junction branch migration protein RuvA [Gemmatimonadota bacterium]